jgi:hypothetical protein
MLVMSVNVALILQLACGERRKDDRDTQFGKGVRSAGAGS